MDAQQATLEKLLPLQGMWTGEGRAEYPTIPTFVYREALTFQRVPDAPRFFLFERTQKQRESGGWMESHWESGFLRVLMDGTLEWLDAQSGGRVEVLRGTLEESPETLQLHFVSTLIENDARMRGTARQFFLNGDALSYAMQMSTENTPTLTSHLSAGLTRFVDKEELLRRIEHGRQDFWRAMDGAADSDLEAPNAVGEWSVKDLLAHFIGHEQRTLDELNAARRGETYSIDHAANQAFNAQAVGALRDPSLTRVREAWLASSNQILAMIESMSDADFEPFSPVCVLLGDTIDGALGNNTYGHYAEHLPGVQAWLHARI